MTEFTRSTSSTRISKLLLMIVLQPPKTNKSADELIERTSFMLDEIESKTIHKDEEGDLEREKK